MALTSKQKRFIQEYSLDQNGTQAYIRAGYNVGVESARRASSLLLKNPEIKAEIEKIENDLSDKTGITREMLMLSLKDTHDKCKQLVAVKDKDGNVTGEYKFDTAGTLKAIELMGKGIGMFKDKSEVELKVTKKLEDFFA